jgi:hypothetical protein
MSEHHPDRVSAANAEVLRLVLQSTPFLIDIGPASRMIAGIDQHDILHAGPPLASWDEVYGPLRGAIVGTLMLKGAARDAGEAEDLVRSGEWRLRSAHDLNALGTFANVIVSNTTVFVIENRTAGVRAYAAINEGRGRALRYGSNTPETLERLAWLEGEFADILGAAVQRLGGVDLFAILEQALHMCDDGHSRQKAASALFLGAVAPCIAEYGFGASQTAKVLRFLNANDFFFLPLAMAAAKSTMAAVPAVAGSTLVTAIAFNGVRCGIQISDRPGQWFTAPVPAIRGQYFSPYGEANASPVIGDSEIVETMGLGAFAMAAAPALARYAGGSVEEAADLSRQMYEITIAEHPRFSIPALSFRGTPLGIDVRRVLERGIEPAFNTGIAHRDPGVGQIGAGFGRVPMACFQQAAAD